MAGEGSSKRTQEDKHTRRNIPIVPAVTRRLVTQAPDRQRGERQHEPDKDPEVNPREIVGDRAHHMLVAGN